MSKEIIPTDAAMLRAAQKRLSAALQPEFDRQDKFFADRYKAPLTPRQQVILMISLEANDLAKAFDKKYTKKALRARPFGKYQKLTELLGGVDAALAPVELIVKDTIRGSYVSDILISYDRILRNSPEGAWRIGGCTR